jgi:hypothetical protein
LGNVGNVGNVSGRKQWAKHIQDRGSSDVPRSPQTAVSASCLLAPHIREGDHPESPSLILRVKSLLYEQYRAEGVDKCRRNRTSQ